MKKVGLGLGVGLVAIVALAVVKAGQMGETSHAFARGTVVLAPELEADAKSLQTLYIIASNVGTPMPIGALRKTVSEPSGLVYEFALTNESMQRMQPDQPFPEEFKLKARLDADGAAGPDQPGDLVGEVMPVRVGMNGIEIMINRKVAQP